MAGVFYETMEKKQSRRGALGAFNPGSGVGGCRHFAYE